MKDKYPALEIIIALYKIITAITFIVSFIVFGYISEEHGFLQGFIITTSIWIADLLILHLFCTKHQRVLYWIWMVCGLQESFIFKCFTVFPDICSRNELRH